MRTDGMSGRVGFVPHSGVAGLGLGVAFGALEAWRYPVYGNTGAVSLGALDSNLASIATLALCCLFYALVRKRLARPAVVASVSCLAAASLVCFSLAALGTELPFALRALASLHMAFGVLLFMLWMEELLRMPDEKAVFVAALGLMATFLVEASVILVQEEAKWVVSSLLPLLSGALYLLHRRVTAAYLGPGGHDGRRAGRPDDSRLDLASMRRLLPMFAISLICGLVFGLLNSAWRGTDLGLEHPVLVQLDTALGALGAGVVLMLLRKPIRRGYLEMLIVVFALAALLMEQTATLAPAVFLVPLNMSQKLMFVLFMAAAQRSPDRPLRSLAYCSMFLAYRVGLYIFRLLRDTVLIGSESAANLLVAAGCIALTVFAIYEIASAKPSEQADAQDAKTIDYYRKLAFGYYLTQRYGLTQRESAVAMALVDGSAVQQIADDLEISQSTVKTHLHNIFAKCGVHSQAEFLDVAKRERTLFFSLPAPQGK